MKTVSRVILAAIFLALTALLAALAKSASALVFAVYPTFSRAILAKIAAFTRLVPFALWEILALLAALWALYTLIRSFVRRRFLRWAAGVLLAASAVLFVFTAVWGLGHFGPGAAAELGLTVRGYTEQELVDAADRFAAKAGELAPQVKRDDGGVFAPGSFSALAARAGDGYASLAEKYPMFGGSAAPVKPLAAAKLWSYFGTTGVFFPLTAECTVNPDTFAASLPFTMCHELAHRMGVTAEDEANFCAFLACRANDSAEFRYSGYYSAFLYCYNALCETDPSAAAALWERTPAQVRTDCLAASAHYEPYEGKVQDAAQSVNDAYLKAFSEEAGVRSYGRVADLLIALCQAENT